MELQPGIDARCFEATEDIPMPLNEPQGFRIAYGDTVWWLCVDPETFDAPKNEYKTSKDGRHNTWLDAVSSVLSDGGRGGSGGGGGAESKSTLEKMQFDRDGYFRGLVQSSHNVGQHGPSGHRSLRGEKKDPSCQFWSHLEVSLPEESQQESHLRAWTAASGLTRHPTRQTYRVSVPLHFDDNEKSFALEPRLGCWTHFLSDPSEMKRSFTLEDMCAIIEDVAEEEPEEHAGSDVEVMCEGSSEGSHHANALSQWNSVKNMRRGVVGFLSAAAKAAAATDDSAFSAAAVGQDAGGETLEKDERRVHNIELDSLRADMRRMAKTLSALERFIKERVEKLERAVLANQHNDQIGLRLASNQSTLTVEADARESNNTAADFSLVGGVEKPHALSENRGET
jgi:hypothetical protein